MTLDLSTHPCFNEDARHSFGRIHLPVAPKCNIQCNYCNRQTDCPNESRPGVTSKVLSPGQAMAFLDRMLTQQRNLSVVGIAGPGDPFATADLTLETLRLVRERHPQMLLCVASNGLGLTPAIVRELATLQVSHVTLTINAVEPEIAQPIYAWVRDGKQILRGLPATTRLIERQLAAIQMLKAERIVAKINTVVIPGINGDHVSKVASVTAALGADMQNCLSIYPVQNTPFATITPMEPDMLDQKRAQAAEHLPQMRHCARCRADAVGLLGEGPDQIVRDELDRAARQPIHPHEDRPYVAVASQEGVLVNLHLGLADRLWIFGHTVAGTLESIACRPAPPAGGGKQRWVELANCLKDCRAVLAAGIGQAPSDVLEQAGIQPIAMEGLIEDAVLSLLAGKAPRSVLRPRQVGVCGRRSATQATQADCGSACGGNGMGCA